MFDFNHLVKREMSSYIEQLNIMRFKEVTFSLVFLIILWLIICKQNVEANDACCESETLYWGTELIPITWPKASDGKKLVASDCLHDKKLLLLRACEYHNSGGWNPDITATESACKDYQPPTDKYGKCPPNYIQFGNSLCYHVIETDDWQDRCLKTGGSSLSFFDLPTIQQYKLLNHLSESYTDTQLSGIGMPARNKAPMKAISLDIDYSKEDLDVEWLLPGRYGSIKKFSNNSASVSCSGYKNVCIGICLFIDGSHATVNSPFVPGIDICDNLINVLCVAETNSVLRSFGCSKSEYFHVTYETSDSLCYSINFFQKPLTMQDIVPTIVPDHCDGNNLFKIDSLEAHIIYSQLAQLNQLKKHDRCLFGVALSNNIITYDDWYAWTDHDQITFTNWDKKMDFNVIQSSGNSLLTVKPDGKWIWEKEATCIVCVMEDTPSSVELTMNFNTNDSMLTLRVIGQKYLWKNDSSLGFLCFARNTNMYMSDLQVIHNGALGYYSVENVGAGIYWCTGHVIRTFELIETVHVFAFGMIFVVYVQRHCDDRCIEQVDHAEKFEKALIVLIDEDLMKIEDLQYIEHDMDYTDTQIKLIFHIVLSIKEELYHENEPNEIELPDDQLNCYYALQKLQKFAMTNENTEFHILSIKSTEFCLPDSIALPETINWKAAAVGETITLTNHCLNLARTCSRSGSRGAIWEDYVIIFACDDQHQSEATKTLVDLRNGFRSANQTTIVIANLTTTLQNVILVADDVFIVSQIFEQISNYLLTDQICLEYYELKQIFEIFNCLMSIEKDVAEASTRSNSTNSLLASFDEILIHQTKAMFIDHTFFADGIASIKTPLLTNFVLDPVVSGGISGIVLLENGTNENLLSYSVRYLHANQPVKDLLKEESLVVASFIPERLLENWDQPKIILTVFFNDILFQSLKQEKRADGKIISLTVLNSNSIFPSSIPLYFRSSHYSNYDSTCGYWSFTSINGWEPNGCLLKQVSLNLSIPIVLCECTHLTHFGNLITDKTIDDFNEKVLNLITLAGCSLSLFGIIGIFITAMVFRSWRSKSSSKFLLQLSAAIALQMILLIFVNSDENILSMITENIYGCIAIGAFIHYSVLTNFFWMLIVAYLQFIRYVIVFSQLTTANFLVKSSIFGWGLPLLPVFLVISIDPKSYIPSSTVKLCYPSGYALLFGVLIPIAVIIIANIFVFVSVIVSLIKGSSKSAACKINVDKNEAIWSQLRLSAFLFFLLGISWIFGFLSINGSILFSYLFCLTATMQGFVLFLYFVVLDPVARNLWKKLFLKMLRQKNN